MADLHPGGRTGFIAQMNIDPGRDNAVLLVTNVHEKHEHLFKAMSRIKAY